MVSSRLYLLLLALVSAKALVAEKESLWSKLSKRIDWNDQTNYAGVDFKKATENVDFDSIFQNGGANGQGQQQSNGGQGQQQSDGSQGQQQPDGSNPSTGQNSQSSSSPSPGSSQVAANDNSDNSQDVANVAASNDQSNGHDNGSTKGGSCDYDTNASGDKSSASCPEGCAVTVAFTDNTCKNVPFVTSDQSQALKATGTGNTHGSCICMPNNSARINIGSTDTMSHSTLIETNGKQNGLPAFFDVSYVEGYNYPVVCWNSAEPNLMSGSNIDLYEHDKCHDTKATKMGDICVNPGFTKLAKRDPASDCMRCTLPSQFFAPASGAAYTYPFDDCPCASGPSKDGNYGSPMATGEKLLCCVGPQCKPNTYSVGGQTANGNCQRPDCKPCSGMGQCGACNGNAKPPSQKRDMEAVLAYAEQSLAYQKTTKKRHAHHHRHSGHGVES